MKTKILSIATVLFIAITISSCTKKQGCIDSAATNYDANAEEDNGSCTYDAGAAIWWNQDFADAADSASVTKVEVNIDGVLLQGMNIQDGVYASAPPCSQSGVILVSRQITSDGKTVSASVTAYDANDNQIGTSVTWDINLQTQLLCNSYQLDESEFQW